VIQISCIKTFLSWITRSCKRYFPQYKPWKHIATKLCANAWDCTLHLQTMIFNINGINFRLFNYFFCFLIFYRHKVISYAMRNTKWLNIARWCSWLSVMLTSVNNPMRTGCGFSHAYWINYHYAEARIDSPGRGAKRTRGNSKWIDKMRCMRRPGSCTPYLYRLHRRSRSFSLRFYNPAVFGIPRRTGFHVPSTPSSRTVCLSLPCNLNKRDDFSR